MQVDGAKGAGCQSVRRDDFKFMTRLGNGAEMERGRRQGSGWERDVEAQTHQRISLFEKCLYLRSRSRPLSPPIACASSGLAMFTGKVGRRREWKRSSRRIVSRGGGERRGVIDARAPPCSFRARRHCTGRSPVQSGLPALHPPSPFRPAAASRRAAGGAS